MSAPEPEHNWHWTHHTLADYYKRRAARDATGLEPVAADFPDQDAVDNQDLPPIPSIGCTMPRRFHAWVQEARARPVLRQVVEEPLEQDLPEPVLTVRTRSQLEVRYLPPILMENRKRQWDEEHTPGLHFSTRTSASAPTAALTSATVLNPLPDAPHIIEVIEILSDEETGAKSKSKSNQAKGSLTCSKCLKPIKRVVWILRCGHVLDSRCYQRVAEKRVRSKNRPKSHAWLCPVGGCLEPHRTLWVLLSEGWGWMSDPNDGPARVDLEAKKLPA
ncbi:hypothetical protein FRC09_008493 [Ceratobasidium sp. 395]|nr:hypothetical protein FRC09_008493 [Ceratobasidium sp. 395]